ncbi:lysostaphin resistance A-like protein [Thermodesulfobacteriota bacterium]
MISPEKMENKMYQSMKSTAVAWFIIITAIVLAQYAIYNRNRNAPVVGFLPDARIEFIGKYTVGTKQVLAKYSMPMKNFSQLKKEFQKIQGAKRQLSTIPILAELSGRDTALLELKHLAEYPEEDLYNHDLQIFHQLYYKGSASLDSKQRLALKRYGWIGKLALSQDKPDSNPERQAVLRSASHMVILVILFGLTGLAAVFGGLILLIIAIVLLCKGRLRSHIVIPENTGNLFLECFAIYIAGCIAMPVLILMVAPGFHIGVVFLTVLAVLVSILWPRLRGLEWKDYNTALGWNLGKGILREAGAGVTGYIAGLPLILIAGICVVIMAKYTGKLPYHPVVDKLTSSPVYLFLLACVWAPIVEETLFRGALFGYLRRSLSWGISGIITGLIFAALHPQGWIAIPVLAVIGFNLSIIREWRGSIIAPITAHALSNGSVVLILILAMS